jgi:eukaryotic-like serine/threonine-protein kinase
MTPDPPRLRLLSHRRQSTIERRLSQFRVFPMAESKSSHSVKTAVARSGLEVDPPTISQRLLASGQSTAGQSATHLPADDQSPSVTGHLLANRYQLVEKLGAGAMGTVYQAQDNKLGRTVAIKILPERSTPDPEAVARFQREARALAKLSHPSIVQAFDEDEHECRHFLVME